MEGLFIKLLNMSITASWLVGIVVLLRLLFKRAPKALTCLLWVLVAIRLVCPFSFESPASLIPNAEPVKSERIYRQVEYKEEITLPVRDTETAVKPKTESVHQPITVTAVASVIWAAGIAGMLLYCVLSLLNLRRKTEESICTDGIWICDNLDSPFILGVIRPRIYLPSDTLKADEEYVIAHERAHIARGDHVWKLLGFILLSVYWFNPMMWIGYILLSRDIEFACDERVIRDFGTEQRKAYSYALINCGSFDRRIPICPPAFGEVGIGQRIKSVLSYKKPALWIIIAAVVLGAVVAVCFMTNPPKKRVKDVVPKPTAAETISTVTPTQSVAVEATPTEIKTAEKTASPTATKTKKKEKKTATPTPHKSPRPTATEETKPYAGSRTFEVKPLDIDDFRNRFEKDWGSYPVSWTKKTDASQGAKRLKDYNGVARNGPIAFYNDYGYVDPLKEGRIEIMP